MPLIPILKTSHSFYCEDDEGDDPFQPSTSQVDPLDYGDGSTRGERIEMRDYGREYGRAFTQHGISNLGYDGEDYDSLRHAVEKRDPKGHGRHATDQGYGREFKPLQEDSKKYCTQSITKQAYDKRQTRDYGNRSRESSNRRSESEDKITTHMSRFRATSAPREILKSKDLSLIINPLMSSSYHSTNNKIEHSRAIIRDKEINKYGKLIINVKSRSRSRSESEPFQRETSEPRYVEWSDYVMRTYENLPTLAYSTFHEFSKKDEKIHCKITIYDNSWFSQQKAFALAFIMKSSETYFTGAGFHGDFEIDQRQRSPAIDTFRKVGRSFFEKIGLVAKRRDLVHETAPADELPEYPLDDFCKRPIEFFHEEKKFSFNDLLSAKEKEELKPQGEKCSYLFRGASLEELGEFPADLQPEYEYDPYCPVHGSRRRLRRRKDKLITMQTLMSSVDNADSADRLPSYIYSQDFIAKIIRKQKRLQMSGEEKRRADKIMQKIKSNLWTISLAFLFLFTAFHGLQNLQTSVNDRLGGDSLMAHYISLAISSLFVPSFMIDRLGCKQTLIISMSIYTLYIFTNFLPRYYSLIPSSILAGIAGSCLWGAKCAYITECGMRYARLNVEAPNTVIVRFFGYFFMIVHLGQVSGNLISSYILEAAIGFVPPHDQVIDTCGHGYPKNFSELSERAALNLLRPPQSAIVSVCAAYLGCAIVAVMIVAMFLNALHKDTINRTKKPQFDAQILKLSLKNFANVKVLLLIPLTIFNGLEQAFVVGVYTKSFVGCGLGISQIGFVMTAFGVTDAVCSLVFGPLIKLFGRTPLFVFGAVINMLMIVTLAIWSLNPTDSLVFYVIAGVWGMADGVWNTQINGFWVALVGRQSLDLAFANYRFWESLGIALGFLLLRFTSVQEFLWISISVLLLGICGYICIELYDLIIGYLNMEKLMEMMCIWRRKPLPTQEPTSMQVSLLSSTPMATSATQPTSMLTSITTTNPETI